MQSQNNLSSEAQKRLVRLRILFFGSIGFVLLFLFLVGLSTSKKKPVKNEYFDQASGETISNPSDKSGESYGEPGQKIAYLGFGKLLENGITKTQLDKVKSLLSDFSKNKNLNTTEISLTSDGIGVYVPEIGSQDTNTVITGKITVNRTGAYAIEISYASITEVRLVVKDNGTQAYDSGVQQLFELTEIDD